MKRTGSLWVKITISIIFLFKSLLVYKGTPETELRERQLQYRTRKEYFFVDKIFTDVLSGFFCRMT